MTPPDAGSRGVSGAWVHLDRSVAKVAGGYISTVTITAPAATTTVGVEVVEPLPDDRQVLEVGVHPEREPDAFEADATRLAFRQVVTPGDAVEVVYGVRVAGSEPLAPHPLAIEKERLFAAEGASPPGLTADGGLSAVPLPADVGSAPSGSPAGSTADGPHAIRWPAEEEDGQAADDDPADASEPAPASPSVAVAPDDAGFVFPADAPAAEPRPEARPAEPAPDVAPANAEADAHSHATTAEAHPAESSPEEAPAAPEPAATAEAEAVSLETLREAGNVLVLSEADATDGGCTDLLGLQLEPDDALVLVSLVETADRRLEAVAGLPGERDVDLVCLGEEASAAAEGGPVPTPLGPTTVTAVADPGDLFRLGIHASRAIDAADGRPALCLHSLTALLGLADLRRVFRFVHVLSCRVETAGGRAHYHLDPAATDEQTLETLRPLFDAVVRYDDGDWLAA